MAINSALTVLLAVCVLPEITSSAVELTASPTSLDDGQGVVIYIQSDSPPHHLDAVVATCTNGLGTSVVQRVPRTTAVVAAPCDVAEFRLSTVWLARRTDALTPAKTAPPLPAARLCSSVQPKKLRTPLVTDAAPPLPGA